MFHPDDVIGPYALVRPLGRGAYGEVWLAEERSPLLTTQVALKLPLALADDTEKLRQEAQLWQKASGHPNVVPVLGAHIYEGQVVIASEYIAGGTLTEWLGRRGGVTPTVADAVTMARGILTGLEHLHSAGIVHRDLKPDNVLLQGRIPRLTDFGLARVLRTAGHTSSITGTPSYMAPEAFSGDYSPASDLWAIGTILYEMLTGALPFPQTDIMQLIQAIQREQPSPLPLSVPEALRTVVSRLLAKLPLDRYASAATVRGLLQAESAFHLPEGSAALLPAAAASANVFLCAGPASGVRSARTGPDRESAARLSCRQILRDTAIGRGGTLPAGPDDAFLAVFTTASDALGAALDAQRLTGVEDGASGEWRQIRIGLHAGQGSGNADCGRRLSRRSLARGS